MSAIAPLARASASGMSATRAFEVAPDPVVDAVLDVGELVRGEGPGNEKSKVA